MQDLSGPVERSFIHPVHLGENVLPYRLAEPLSAVIPVSIEDSTRLASIEEIDTYPGLSQWWDQVETHSRAHRVKSEKKPLRERVDYNNQLSAQLPQIEQVVSRILPQF